MAKQIHGSLSSRSKSKSEGLSLRIILLVVLVVAVSVGAILWFALLQSIQDQQQHGQQVSSTVTSSAVQKLRSVRAKVQLASRKEADAGHKAEALQPTTKQSVVLKTTVGDIAIVLRPDLSAESVDYIRQIAALNDCANCKLYRAEKPGILQGIIANRKKVPVNTIKGSCPPGYQDVPNECPEWDKNCACHGPVMHKGMVAWAAGDTGPDFFIDGYKRKADWWGTQHTVWGEIQDAASFGVIDKIWTLPTHEVGDLIMLNKELKFELVLK